MATKFQDGQWHNTTELAPDVVDEFHRSILIGIYECHRSKVKGTKDARKHKSLSAHYRSVKGAKLLIYDVVSTLVCCGNLERGGEHYDRRYRATNKWLQELHKEPQA